MKLRNLYAFHDSVVASDDEDEDDDGIGRRLKDENVCLYS